MPAWVDLTLFGILLFVVGFAVSWGIGLIRLVVNRSRADGIIEQSEQEAFDEVSREFEPEAILSNTRSEFEREKERLEQRIESLSERVESLESRLDGREEMLSNLGSDIEQREEQLSELRSKLESTRETYKQKLLELTDIDPDQLTESIRKDLISTSELNTSEYVKRSERLAESRQEFHARRILARAMNRTDVITPVEVPSASLKFPDEDAYEQFEEFYEEHEDQLIDDIDSGVRFDEESGIAVVETLRPVDKTIAYRTLNNLIQQKKFNYELIQQGYERYTNQVVNEQRQAAREALNSCGIEHLPDTLFENLGVLHFRTSFGQQQLVHSLEVAHLSAMIAAELGANVMIARRAGLLHDVGKAIDRQRDSGHAIVGANLAEEAGEEDIIINAIGSHHGDMEPEYVESHIVAAADAISGSRPGARRENMSNYSKRIEQLLELAQDREGIRKVSAMNAGRELRIRVKRNKITDEQLPDIAHEIAAEIEQEITYSGEIKINTIRETKVSRTIDD